jgi:glycosyltransferase involved in cell wall biosynthesis
LEEEDFEVIIINDGTKDRSMEVIQDIISQHHNITVVNQENQGLSVVRNNGIAMAKGKYILMPDSDDLLIENSLKPLLEKALETKDDLVVADFLAMTDEEIDNFYKKEFKQPELQFNEGTGEPLYLEILSPHQCYVWRTLYRREFLVAQNLAFYPGIRYQDIPFTHECYLKANSYYKTNQFLNIYRRWPGSSTNAYKIDNSKDFIVALAKTWELRQIKGLSSNILYKLEENVYTSFRMMLYHTLHILKKKSDRNYIIDFLNVKIPTLNFTHSIQQRLITFMVKRMPHLFINLYYQYAQIVYKKRYKIWKK